MRCWTLPIGVSAFLLIYLLYHSSSGRSKLPRTGSPEFSESPSKIDDFSLLINARCSQEFEAKLVVVVTSKTSNFKKRSAQREAFPKSHLQRQGIHRVFLLARADHREQDLQQGLINAENEAYGDLVQGNFTDDYKNLAYKNMMGLRWAGSFCGDAQYILKMDDDIIVDLNRLLPYLNTNFPVLSAEILGYIHYQLEPKRDPTSKWFVTREEFPGDVYPDFLSGWAYIMSPQTARQLSYWAKTKTAREIFWIDDLWITGILASELGISLQSINSFFSPNADWMRCCLQNYHKKCQYMVGPYDDDVELLISFGNYSQQCQETKCYQRSQHSDQDKPCPTADKFIHQGQGQVFVVPNSFK